MAGRKNSNPARWEKRAARASTPADQLAVAYDRLRATLAHLSRPQRDGAADAERARELAARAAEFLTGLCEGGDRA